MATYYLNADTGNDTTGDGSSGNPWQTLGKAETEHANGDIFILQNATADYTMGQVLSFDGVTIRGASQSGVTIDRNSTGFYFETINGSTCVFEDFTSSQTGVGNALGSPWRRLDNTTTEITRVIFESQAVGEWQYPGTSGTDSTITFLSCVFRDIYRPGITHNMNGNAFGQTGVVVNFHNCLHFWTGADVDIGSGGIWGTAAGASADILITMKNCCIYGERSASTQLGEASQTASWVFENCNFYAVNGWTNVPTGTDNLATDPLMVDADGGNYALRPSSPQIDAGQLL